MLWHYPLHKIGIKKMHVSTPIANGRYLYWICHKRQGLNREHIHIVRVHRCTLVKYPVSYGIDLRMLCDCASCIGSIGSVSLAIRFKTQTAFQTSITKPILHWNVLKLVPFTFIPGRVHAWEISGVGGRFINKWLQFKWHFTEKHPMNYAVAPFYTMT